MDEHARPGGDDKSHLQMHFDTPAQQFDSSKLGMWIFLGTELLMFGGLFCAYAVYRANHPDIFAWGSMLLDRKLGGINTLVLITSSFTMAAAVSAAQRGWRWRQVALLFLTFLGACGFLVIKAIEYRPKFEHGLVWGTGFRPDMHYVEAHWRGHAAHGEEEGEAEPAPEAAAPAAIDLERGRRIAYETCASCHGADLRGMPNNGKDMVSSEFIRSKTDEELLAFLKVGRAPWDPENTTRIQMPPRGGNPTLDDDKLRDVIAFLRVVQEAGAETGGEDGGEGDAVVALGPPAGPDGDGFFFPKSVIPPAAAAPAGLVQGPVLPTGSVPLPPPNAHRFFAVYFLMTGLHAIHVVAGMLIILWLMAGAALGRYGAAYFTPVDLGGLFWHLVDLIWIFLFPLFYLI